MAYTEVLTTHSLTAEQFDAQIFAEYIGRMWWSNITGTTSDSVIVAKDDLMKKAGDAITIGTRGLMVGGKVTGNNKGVGNEGALAFYGQRITIDNVRQVIKFEDVPMSNKRVPWDILQQGKEALVEKSQLDLDEEITKQLSDTSTGRVRGRYLYGAADSNWQAVHATGLTAVDNTNDQLTVKMLGIAKRKADIPINATARVRPMRIVNGKNYESWYVFVGHTYAIRDMVDNDAVWRNAQINLPPRGNGDSPIYSGSSFKGAWNGVLVYEYDRINLVSSTIQVSHNFLLGAQAAAIVWGQRSKFGEEEFDLGHDVVYETHEIRGVSKIFFDRATQEDNGIVHVFAAAVAD